MAGKSDESKHRAGQQRESDADFAQAIAFIGDALAALENSKPSSFIELHDVLIRAWFSEENTDVKSSSIANGRKKQ